jgi:hypothetical protein
VQIRLLDWLESLLQTAAEGQAAAAEVGPVSTEQAKAFYQKDLLRMGCEERGDMPPQVPMHQRFARILGTDVMYEPPHAQLVAAVLAHRCVALRGSLGAAQENSWNFDWSFVFLIVCQILSWQ